MNGWFERVRGHLITAMVTIGVLGFWQWYLARPPGTPVELTVIEPTVAPTATLPPTATPAPLAVFVSGAVARPNVYELPPGSLVQAAIQAAGGLAAEADPAAVNQALRVVDGMQIHVPAQGTEPPPALLSAPAEPPPPSAPTAGEASSVGGLIDLNGASTAELDTLPGIGPVLAERIVSYRESQGPFQSVEELNAVQGIGEKLFAQLQPLVTVR